MARLHPRPAAFLLVALLVACRMESQPPPTEPAGSTAGAHQVVIGEVLWYVDYDAAVDIAVAEDKPLWVHFGENPG